MVIGAQFSLNENFNSAVASIPQGTIEWLKLAAEKHHVPNFSVRGQLTKAVFEHIGLGDKAVALGQLPFTFFKSR